MTQVFNSDSVTRNLSFVQSYTPSKLPVLLDCYSDAAKTKPLPVDVFLSVSGYRAIGVINLNLSLSSSTPNQVMSINSTFSVLLQVALTPLGTMSQLTFGILAYCSQSPSFKDKYYAWIFNYKLTGSDYVIIQKNDFIKPLSIAFGLLVFGLRAQTRRLVEMAYEPVTNFQQVTTSNSTVETLKYQVGGDVDYTYLHFSAIYCYPGLLIAYNLTVPFCYTNLSCNTSLYQTYNVTYSNSTCQVSCPLKTYYTTRYGGACLNCTDYG